VGSVDFPKAFSSHKIRRQGSLNMSLPRGTPSLKNDIYKHGAPPNADKFIDFLEHMLVLDPAKRACCNDLLAHDWLAL